MRNSTKILLFLSLFIALSDGTFVLMNYHNSKDALHQSLQMHGREQRRSFELSLADIEKTMALMATYVANNPEIADLFHKGATTALAEGGGPGGEKTAVLRRQLFEMVYPGWEEVTRDFQVRQLHFHMGPGSTSFLRVHKPHRFGDIMHQCRYTVVAVNEGREMVTGFETGRVVSGIRGVVPVIATDPTTGQKVRAGALEAGTSFDTFLPDLSRRLGAGIAVLLTEEHVQRYVWPEMMNVAFEDTTVHEGFLVEASIGPNQEEMLSTGDLQDLLAEPRTILRRFDDVPMAVTGFPLRDFRGQENAELPPSGLVVIWSAATDQVVAFQEDVWANIFYAMVGFCVVEILLFLAVNLITRHLQRIIDCRSRQLSRAQDKLLEQARKVGMAEVATEVLHNVGNVLNSLVVGTRDLSGRLAGSRVGGVKKAAGLLQPAPDTGGLPDQAEMARKLPAYLESLGRQLESEQAENLASVERITRYVDHISTIVNNQQDHCRAGQLVQEVDLRETIDEALEICQMRGTGCIVEKVFDLPPDLPPLHTNRHRLLQVLVNLTRNAGQAMSDMRRAPRTLIYRAEIQGEALRLTVADNGRGISPENLERIFQHGFTTKKEGHGFGLHGSFNTIKEMGGHLSARSEGPDKGASFILEIPFQPGGKIHV